MLYRAFVAGWEAMEAEEIERKRRYKEERAGGRGPRPAADAYGDCQKRPAHTGRPARVSEPSNRCALHPVYMLMLDLVRKYYNNY